MIYHPYQFFVSTPDINIIRALAHQNFGTKEMKQLDMLYFEFCLEEYLGMYLEI